MLDHLHCPSKERAACKNKSSAKVQESVARLDDTVVEHADVRQQINGRYGNSITESKNLLRIHLPQTRQRSICEQLHHLGGQRGTLLDPMQLQYQPCHRPTSTSTRCDKWTLKASLQQRAPREDGMTEEVVPIKGSASGASISEALVGQRRENHPDILSTTTTRIVRNRRCAATSALSHGTSAQGRFD